MAQKYSEIVKMMETHTEQEKKDALMSCANSFLMAFMKIDANPNVGYKLGVELLMACLRISMVGIEGRKEKVDVIISAFDDPFKSTLKENYEEAFGSLKETDEEYVVTLGKKGPQFGMYMLFFMLHVNSLGAEQSDAADSFIKKIAEQINLA